MVDWGTARDMNTMEAAMWRAERHPSFSDTGVLVGVLDDTPDWDRLRRAHEWVLRVVPRFREHVVEPLLSVGPPRWATDEMFDLDYHLRRIRLPGPGTIEALMSFAEADAVTPFDRRRPLWHGTFVEGLEDGRSAYVLRLHHCLSDGMGAMQLLSLLQRRTVGAGGPPPRPATPSLSVAAAHAGAAAAAAPRRAVRLAAAAGGALRQPAASAAYARSLLRLASPSAGTPAPLLNGGSRQAWRFSVLECSLAELKAAGKAAGGTLNDAYIAAVLGGLARYHRHLGLTLEDLPMTMPVSIRRPGDPAGGNRFTAAFLAAPASVEDPAARIRAVRRSVSDVSGEPALDFLESAIGLLNLAPTPVVAATMQALQARSDITVTNIVGMREPVCVDGALVERLFCFGPLPGTALCAALCSHGGICCIGLNADGSAFTETGLLWTSMAEALDEVLALGKETA